MPPPPAAAPSDSSAVIWIVIGLFALIAGLWFVAHTQLVTGFFFLKKYEIIGLQFFTGPFTHLEDVKQFIEQTSPSTISYEQFHYVAARVGIYVRFIVVAIMLVLSFVLFSKNLITRYSQVHSMQSLLEKEVDQWPYSKIILDKDLVHQDIDSGPWAMAMPPMAFAKKNHLLKEYVEVPSQVHFKKEEKVSVALIQSRAARVFALQLGKPWEGVEALNDYTKALYAAFVAKAARRSDDSRELLMQLAASAAEGRLNLTGVDELLEKCKDYPPVVNLVNRHGYILTVMASVLQLARTDGVLSSAEFLWLKAFDRRMWFMLNAVGRQTATVEVAGPFAHWLAEKKLGRKLRTPMVDQAVRALEKVLQEILYSPSSVEK